MNDGLAPADRRTGNKATDWRTIVAIAAIAIPAFSFGLIAWGATVHATREHEIRLAKIRACPVAEE